MFREVLGAMADFASACTFAISGIVSDGRGYTSLRTTYFPGSAVSHRQEDLGSLEHRNIAIHEITR
jgi:hypothetical protein